MDATLLIADGRSRSRDSLVSFFSECGFRLETARDGLECLAKVRSLEPDVLVVDLELPWGGAAAVVAFLNASHFEFRMPAILVLGNAPPPVLAQRTGLPASSCFQKPVQVGTLLDWVGMAMALIDLQRNGARPARRRRLRRSHEACLAPAT